MSEIERPEQERHRENAYDRQRRSDPGAYERYLRGMNASMRQKVALTAAHILSMGEIADMGMGSGKGSEALAALYPALRVVGVDIDSTMVERARERYDLPNLRFEVGDIAKSVFPEESLDAIFNSSVLHHVTSFNGYEADQAARAIEAQLPQLRPHGVLIVRDFLDPGNELVWLDLSSEDGDDSDDPERCSTAALFEKFSREYAFLSKTPGFSFKRIGSADSIRPEIKPGRIRYEVMHRYAAEFVLRKNYRKDWETEVQEVYTYFTQDEFERLYHRLGLRVLTSMPIRNPWIVRNRFRGQVAFHALDGSGLEFPATNYLIVGERVKRDDGVSFREGERRDPIGYLSMEHYRCRDSGQVMTLVRRPNRTLDIVPWFEEGDDLFIMARASYPRPIIRAHSQGTVSLDRSRSAGYVVEPLVVIQTDKPLGMTVEETMYRVAGISGDRIERFHDGTTYYPSAGGIQEAIRSVFVEISSTFSLYSEGQAPSSDLSSRILAIEARQLLRAAQVGGLPDARLELNAYDLLLGRGKAPGPWIGEEISLKEGGRPTPPTTLDDLLSRPSRRRFERAEAPAEPTFLELLCSKFEELNAAGEVRDVTTLEFAIPRQLSLNTIVTAPL
ncbi:MAG: class I SAM-dependent methyltransferase, partial [Deltaproteobacteria bacterium]|nr:class I SAM-dependent methyltransferase [Deltaproteobacteria bacterium]